LLTALRAGKLITVDSRRGAALEPGGKVRFLGFNVLDGA
jgi:hypothetical protein